MTIKPMRLNSPIFIGGSGRSGTTLLLWMLDKHPNIASIKWESHFMVDEIGYPAIIENGAEALPDFLKKMKDFWFRREVKNINRPAYWAGLCDDISEKAFYPALDGFEKNILDSKDENERLKASRDFVDRLMTAFVTTRGKRRWAEKTPKNTIMTDFLLDLFPDAKIVNIIRDGRDVVASMVDRQIWPVQANHRVQSIRKGTKITIENASYYWNANLAFSMNLGQIYPNSYYEIRYESLVLNPSNEIRALAEFLEEEPDANMLNYAIKANSIGRWKELFSADDKSMFKENAGQFLIDLGYVSDNCW